MHKADRRPLQDGDLETREEYLNDLIDRCRETGDEAAAGELRALVRDYPDHHRTLFTLALNHVAVFGDASLEAPLLAALSDTRYNCQAWAAMGCTALGFRAAVPVLVELVDSDQWMVCEQAIIGLGELGDATVVPVLAPLLDDSIDWVRQRAAEALGSIGGPEAQAALMHQLQNRRFARIGHVASALARFTPDVIPRLIEVAGSDDPDERYWAAVALGSTGDERVRETLERLAATDRGTTVFDGEVAVAARKALRTLRRIQAAIAARSEG